MTLFIFDILVYPLFTEWFQGLNFLKIKTAGRTDRELMLQRFGKMFQNKHKVSDPEMDILRHLEKTLSPWLDDKIVIEFDQYLYHELQARPASIDFLPSADFFKKALYPHAYHLFWFEPYEGFFVYCDDRYLTIALFGRINGQAMMDHYALDLRSQETFETQVLKFSHLVLNPKKIQELCLLALQMVIFTCSEHEDSHLQDVSWTLPPNLHFKESPKAAIIGTACGQLIKSAQFNQLTSEAEFDEKDAQKPVLKPHGWDVSWTLSGSKDPVVHWRPPTIVQNGEQPKKIFH